MSQPVVTVGQAFSHKRKRVTPVMVDGRIVAVFFKWPATYSQTGPGRNYGVTSWVEGAYNGHPDAPTGEDHATRKGAKDRAVAYAAEYAKRQSK